MRGTRTILLPSSTAQLLGERKSPLRQSGFSLNPLSPEQPVSPGSAYRRLKGLLEEAGLPDLRFHDLRHTFATHALASGVDAKTLSGILGHTKASFTLDTYTHVTGDMHRNAAEIVGDFMTELLGEEVELWQSSKKRGDGSLHLRKDGRWEGRYVVGYDEKGPSKDENVLAKTKGSARPS